MALLTGQLLFATRDGDRIELDVIVLDRAETPDSPPLGAPLCFDFELPGDHVWREVLARLLAGWAEHLTTIEIDVVTRAGHTMLRVASPTSTIMLDEPHHTA